MKPMKTKIQFVTVKGIVQKNGKILLLKDTSGNWELPGGRIDFGESPEQTLTREFKEELQVDDIKVGDLVHAWTFVVEREDSNRQYIVLMYQCEAAVERLQHSDEHVEVGWFASAEVDKLPMKQGYKDFLKSL